MGLLVLKIFQTMFFASDIILYPCVKVKGRWVISHIYIVSILYVVKTKTGHLLVSCFCFVRAIKKIFSVECLRDLNPRKIISRFVLRLFLSLCMCND